MVTAGPAHHTGRSAVSSPLPWVTVRPCLWMVAALCLAHGAAVAGAREPGTKVLRAADGSVRCVGPAGRAFWFPDSQRLLLVSTAGVQAVAAETGASTTLAPWPDDEQVLDAAMSPDGQQLACITRGEDRLGRSVMALRLWRLDGSGQPRRLEDRWLASVACPQQLAWENSGRSLGVVRGLGVCLVDPNTFGLLASSFAGGLVNSIVAFDRDNGLLLTANFGHLIHWAPRVAGEDGLRKVGVTPGGRSDYCPITLIADGTHTAMDESPARRGRLSYYDLKGRRVEPAAPPGSRMWHLRSTPEGQVTIAVDEGQRTTILEGPIEHPLTDFRVRSTTAGDLGDEVVMSPDGKWLLTVAWEPQPKEPDLP